MKRRKKDLAAMDAIPLIGCTGHCGIYLDHRRTRDECILEPSRGWVCPGCAAFRILDDLSRYAEQHTAALAHAMIIMWRGYFGPMAQEHVYKKAARDAASRPAKQSPKPRPKRRQRRKP